MTSILPTTSRPSFAQATDPTKIRRASFGSATFSSNARTATDKATETDLQNTDAQEGAKKLAFDAEGGLQSAFGRLISDIAKTANRILELEDRKENELLTVEQQGAIDTEISVLQERLQQITSKKDENNRITLFGQISQYIDAAASSLDYGVTGESLVKSYSSSQSLLGAEFNSLIRVGNLSSIRGLQGAINEITEAGATNNIARVLTSSEELVSYLGVQAAFAPKQTEQRDQVATTENDEPIEIKQINFATSSDIALGFRTVPPEDLIRAISSGYDFDLNNTLFLTVNDKDEDDKKEKKEYFFL